VKKRFIIGLVAIFTVVLVGGGLVSNIMGQLYTVNTARFLMDRVNTIITSLDIKVLQTIKGIETVQYTEEDIRMLLNRVEDIRADMGDLNDHIMSRSLASESCGVCHDRPDKLVQNLHSINKKMETAFSDLTMLTSIILTSGAGTGYDRILMDMGVTLTSFHDQIESMLNILTPMTQHINEQVGYNILRIKKTHDATIILTTILVLLGIIVLGTTMTRPIRLLNQGTEAIVKGDYDYRIALKGRDELSVLAERFNYMAEVLANREKRLYQKKVELEELNLTLERKVENRTKALREKQEEINRKYIEVESANEELQASYLQLQSTATELEEAQSKLLENYNILKAMNDELQQANEVKNKFLSIMSHELRTPLTVINGYLSLVLDKNYGNPSKELRDIISVVKEQGNNQLGLIEDLLDLTRIESGEYKLNKQAFLPDVLIHKVVENFRPEFEAKEIEVTVDTDQEMPTVHWDFHKMLQVLQNLLDNALKFTPAGGRISLSARSKSDFVELQVVDNGIGIPKDRQNQIFERFYQVDSSSTRRYGGSGLGLSIVREIVVAHNGKVFVESGEEKGTSFLILMPPGEPDKPKYPDPLGAEPETKGVELAPKGKGETILVVDNDEAFLKMMKMILPREGYNVRYTSDSTKAVHYAKKHLVDLLMLDLLMPEIDGYEVCRRVRRDDEIGDLPIMVVSAAGGNEVARRVFEAGADDHIIKPFDQQDLLSRMNDLLAKSVQRKGTGVTKGDEGVESTEPKG
jgi:signal transduction histidine kinase/ActR/RegA family two-component response regulator